MSPEDIDWTDHSQASEDTMFGFAQLPDEYRLEQNQASLLSGQELLPSLIIDSPEKNDYGFFGPLSWGPIDADVRSYYEVAVPMSPNLAGREQEMIDTIQILDTLPETAFTKVHNQVIFNRILQQRIENKN